MNLSRVLPHTLLLAAIGTAASAGLPQTAMAADAYKIVATNQVTGSGGIDYVYADSEARRLYVPRSSQVLVFDLDTLQSVGAIANTRGVHGAVVDPKTHHGFCSSAPVVMWDSKTLAPITNIAVQGGPDGIFFEPMSERVYILSHGAPNVTAIDPKDGSIAGTIDLGGAPEQAASDGKGHAYIDLEDKGKVAVVDVKTMQKTGEFDLGGKRQPAGLAMDAKNGILFAFCRQPAMCVVLNAADGKILDNLPIGAGCDGGGFNPDSMEAFSSQRDGTLTIIKENSPTSFAVEQTVATKSGAKTCTLDAKTGRIIVITTEALPAAAPAPTAPAVPDAAPGQGFRRGGGRGGPSLLDIIAVGR